MPGLSYYLVRFNYEGFWYRWDSELEAYYSIVTKKKFRKPPAGCTYNDDCWVSAWRDDDDEYYID